MKKFIKELLEIVKSRKQLLGIGLLIGFISFGLWPALLGATCTASASESKDVQYNNKWNWIDFTIIIIGSLIGYLINFLIF